MANGDDITGAAPEVPSAPPTPPPQAGPQVPGGAPGQPPPPILAALARRSQNPQTSSPGMGNMGQGLMQLKMGVDMLQQALPNLPAGSPQHKDLLKALSSLSRHLPQGAPVAGVQQTQIQDLLRSTMRNALMQKLIGQQGQPGGGGGQGGPQGGGGGPGGMPQAPMPSMPMPGA